LTSGKLPRRLPPPTLPSDPKPPAPDPIRRDAERSRQAILDAAERLFAERGFESTSLQEIGSAAGVSRGTPGYFFGSKDALRHAVLDRAIAARRDLVTQIGERAVAAGQPPAETIAELISTYLDFLAADDHFLALIDRESLSGSGHLYTSGAQLESLRDSVAQLSLQLDRGGYQLDPGQLFISCLALCEWPFSHRPLLAGLGVDLGDPVFLATRKRHILELVQAALDTAADR
jgi:TetR/AcrR family transcriptional regulator